MTKQLYDVTLSQSPPSSCHLTATGFPIHPALPFQPTPTKRGQQRRERRRIEPRLPPTRSALPALRRGEILATARALPRCCCVVLSSSPPHSSSVAWPRYAAARRLVPGRAVLRASPGRWRLRRPGGDPPQLWEFSRSVLYPGTRFIPLQWRCP